MKLSWVVSMTWARKMSAILSASTRSAPDPRTFTRASSRSTPLASRPTSWTSRTCTTFSSWARICDSTWLVPRVTMVIRDTWAAWSVSATVRLSML